MYFKGARRRPNDPKRVFTVGTRRNPSAPARWVRWLPNTVWYLRMHTLARQRRLTQPHWRWQSGCVVGDRRDLLKLAVGGEDGGDGGGGETDCLSERSED